MILRVIFVALALAAGVAQAQPYRWVDDKGRVQVHEHAPAGQRALGSEAGAGGNGRARLDSGTVRVRKRRPGPVRTAAGAEGFPRDLFTAPNCKEPCTLAREHLNKRGIPFTETQVWNEETLAQLKERTGGENVPALMVGRTSISGFESTRYDALLDSAVYPKAGALQARSQAAPPLPEGYVPPPTVEPAKPVASEATGKPGPYDASGLTSPPAKPGPYDPSGLTSPPAKPGRYGIPGDAGANVPERRRGALPSWQGWC
jgi:hypothetical protein